MSKKERSCVCDDCRHAQVCKYKEGFQAKSQRIYDLIEKEEPTEQGEPIKVDIRCEYFRVKEKDSDLFPLAPPWISPSPLDPLPNITPVTPTPTYPSPFYPYSPVYCDTSKTNKTE